MQESSIEGVATHDDPESCAVACKGEGEALTGAGAGRVLSREIRQSGAPTLLSEAEGNMHAVVSARRWVALRGRRPFARVESPCTRTGRSSSCPWRMVPRAVSERPEPGDPPPSNEASAPPPSVPTGFFIICGNYDTLPDGGTSPFSSDQVSITCGQPQAGWGTTPGFSATLTPACPIYQVGLGVDGGCGLPLDGGPEECSATSVPCFTNGYAWTCTVQSPDGGTSTGRVLIVQGAGNQEETQGQVAQLSPPACNSR